MNKYLIYEGGQPVYLNDLDFIQQSTADALKAICSGFKFGLDNILLSDSVITSISGSNTEYTVTGNGYIVMGDEVYPILSGSLTVPTDQPVYWVVVSEKYQNETLANNTEVPVYERRYVRLSGTYKEGDIYADYRDVTTFKDKLLSMVVDYLDKTVTEADLKAQLSLTGVISGRCELTYRLKQSGDESIQLDMIAAAYDKTIAAPLVNGKRRLCTYDSSVKNISGVYNLAMMYADNWNDPYWMQIQLTFENGNCYIAAANGTPIEQFPGSTITIINTIKI